MPKDEQSISKEPKRYNNAALYELHGSYGRIEIFEGNGSEESPLSVSGGTIAEEGEILRNLAVQRDSVIFFTVMDGSMHGVVLKAQPDDEKGATIEIASQPDTQLSENWLYRRNYVLRELNGEENE